MPDNYNNLFQNNPMQEQQNRRLWGCPPCPPCPPRRCPGDRWDNRPGNPWNNPGGSNWPWR